MKKRIEKLTRELIALGLSFETQAKIVLQWLDSSASTIEKEVLGYD